MHRWLNKALDLVHPARSVTQIHRSAEAQQAAAQRASHLVLYHFSSCPYCLRVRREIHRLELPIAMRDIHADEAAHRALVAGGGRQTVPCLYIEDSDRDIWLYESAHIVRYLNKRFGSKDAWP